MSLCFILCLFLFGYSFDSSLALNICFISGNIQILAVILNVRMWSECKQRVPLHHTLDEYDSFFVCLLIEQNCMQDNQPSNERTLHTTLYVANVYNEIQLIFSQTIICTNFGPIDCILQYQRE